MTKECACAACPFAVRGRAVNFVAPSIPFKIDGVVILEAPAREDVEKGEPLQDRAGEEFVRIYKEVNGSFDNLSIIHAVACMQKQPEKDVDMRAALAACKPLFAASLAKVPAGKPVLAVGKWAAMQLTGKEKAIGSIRGFYGEEVHLGERPEDGVLRGDS